MTLTVEQTATGFMRWRRKILPQNKPYQLRDDLRFYCFTVLDWFEEVYPEIPDRVKAMEDILGHIYKKNGTKNAKTRAANKAREAAAENAARQNTFDF